MAFVIKRTVYHPLWPSYTGGYTEVKQEAVANRIGFDEEGFLNTTISTIQNKCAESGAIALRIMIYADYSSLTTITYNIIWDAIGTSESLDGYVYAQFIPVAIAGYIAAAIIGALILWFVLTITTKSIQEISGAVGGPLTFQLLAIAAVLLAGSYLVTAYLGKPEERRSYKPLEQIPMIEY